MVKKTVVVLALFLLIFSAGSAVANRPGEQLKESIENIISILKDPKYQDPKMMLERRNVIFRVVEQRFDFTEMAKRSVGEFWQQFSEREQKEFEVAFADLLENSYISRIEKYTDEKVVFGPEQPKGEDAFSVRTEIVSDSHTIPVHYSLHQVDDQWLVYDVSVEGISLVANYRNLFREVIRKDGFSGLMAEVNKRVEKVPN
jgi:phospholipid transport system substrate-binding protein